MYQAKNINILLLLIFSFFTFSSRAQINIIHTIPSPAYLSLDLAFDGENLWVGDGGQDSLLYKISRVDGTVLKTIPQFPISTPTGLTFAEGHLWMTDPEFNLIHKVDTTDGSLVFSFPAPSIVTSTYPSGLAWDGTSLWMIEALSGILFQLDTEGNVLSQSSSSIGAFGSGLTCINESFWFTENLEDKLYELDKNDFSVLQELEINGGMYSNGLAFDGQYLWLAIADDSTSVDSIYQIDLGLPALANKIKTKPKAINIYPNPASEMLFFELESTLSFEELELNIYDLTGTKIYTTNVHNNIFSISLNQFTAGIYNYSFKIAQQIIQSGRFMKQ